MPRSCCAEASRDQNLQSCGTLPITNNTQCNVLSSCWYPYTTSTQQEQLKTTQKLVLRIIFPKVEYYCDQLELALYRPYLQKICHESLPTSRALTICYMTISPEDLWGKDFLVRRDSISDIYPPKTRTDNSGKSLHKNLKPFALYFIIIFNCLPLLRAYFLRGRFSNFLIFQLQYTFYLNMPGFGSFKYTTYIHTFLYSYFMDQK